MPQETQTDYTKADKTDRKINQTYIIVDKQNQQIESVVSQTDAQNEKIAKVTQTVEELNSKISDIADITISAEDNDAKVELDNINQSEPIRIVVRPIGESISYLYPHNNLFPNNTLFSKNRRIRFYNKKTEETTDYELPADLLYYNSEYYDEFILDYDGQSCVVNKRVGYNADGTTYVLDTETTLEFEYPRILLTDGDYEVSVLGYDMAYLFVRLMAQNIYTTQFYTKSETDSIINQTSQSIDLSVNKKLSNYSTTNQMNAQIQLTANNITSTVSQTYETKTNAEKQYTQIKQTTDSISTTVSKKIGSSEVVSSINQSAEQITLNSNRLVVNSNNFKLTKEGNVTCTNANVTGTINSSNAKITGGQVNIAGTGTGNVTLKTYYGNYNTYMSPSNMYQSNGEQHVKIGLTAVSGQSESYGIEIVKDTNKKTYINADLRPWVDNPILRVVGNGSGFGIDANSGVVGISDRRRKEDIVYIDNESSKNIINNLKPCTYKFKNKDRYHRGFIAQEVEETFNSNNVKEQVYLIDEKGEYSLVYDEFLADLVGCCQYLTKKVEELEKKMKENN
jgi:hypothetical protein